MNANILHELHEAESLTDEVERALPSDLRDRIARRGLGLTLGSSFAGPFQVVGGMPSRVVAVDPHLADRLVEQELTASMAMFRKNVTGVDNTIFISVKFPGHAPRIKVAIDPATHLDPFADNASVAIADGKLLAGEKLPSHVRKQVEWFLELNHDTLIDYWEKRIDTDELRERLLANKAAVEAGRPR
jgi:hypothetical protein